MSKLERLNVYLLATDGGNRSGVNVFLVHLQPYSMASEPSLHALQHCKEPSHEVIVISVTQFMWSAMVIHCCGQSCCMMLMSASHTRSGQSV